MTDYNTLQKRRNTIVGGFVVVALCAFLYMVYRFQELPIWVTGLRSFEIMVNFPNARGAQENMIVEYCGRPVGRVINVSLPSPFRDEQGRAYRHINVTIAIKKKYAGIPSNVDIKLVKTGLLGMGSSYIDLQLDPNKPLEPLDPARPETAFLFDEMPPLQGSMDTTSEFIPKNVQNNIKSFVDAVNALAKNINDIIGDADNKANIKQTLANVNDLTDRATRALKSIEDFSDVSAEAIGNTAEQLDSTLAELQMVLKKVHTGDGTAAMLLNDGRLYDNLLDTTVELKITSEQLKIITTDIKEGRRKLIKLF